MTKENVKVAAALKAGSADYVTEARFAEMIGKSTQAVADMRKAGKLPYVTMKKPDGSRNEYYISVSAWNEGMDLARATLPDEIRNGWLVWLGLGKPQIS
ncbi:Cox family DNA-binding protein [Morganella morganii]|uniref:Cox family DNA-binding protein n=1 Tax=Morganella morganii TaxID=582 RepID=UPI00339BD4A9